MVVVVVPVAVIFAFGMRRCALLIWIAVAVCVAGRGPGGSRAQQERQDCLGLFPTTYCDLHYPDPATNVGPTDSMGTSPLSGQCAQPGPDAELRACRGLRAAVQGASAKVVHSKGLAAIRGLSDAVVRQSSHSHIMITIRAYNTRTPRCMTLLRTRPIAHFRVGAVWCRWVRRHGVRCRNYPV